MADHLRRCSKRFYGHSLALDLDRGPFAVVEDASGLSVLSAYHGAADSHPSTRSHFRNSSWSGNRGNRRCLPRHSSCGLSASDLADVRGAGSGSWRRSQPSGSPDRVARLAERARTRLPRTYPGGCESRLNLWASQGVVLDGPRVLGGDDTRKGMATLRYLPPYH